MSFLRYLGRVGVLSGGVLAAAAVIVAATAQDDEQVAQMAANGNARTQGQRPDRCARLAEHLDRINKNLTAEQIRDIVAGRLAQSGMNTLKVGKVRSDNGVVGVDITTTSGSLVVTREISQKTGMAADLLQRCQASQARRTAMMAKRNGGQGAQNGGDNQNGAQRDGHRMSHDGGHGHWMMRARFRHNHMQGNGRMGQIGTYAMIGNVGPGRDLKLSSDQAKKLVEASVVMLGNGHLKVGAAKEKDGDTVTVDVVTQDNALVYRQEVDRHSGRISRAKA